jgi:hypothetical protein
MASSIDEFGLVSDGLDRAQIGVPPAVTSDVDTRPSPETLSYHKPSIRQAIRDNFLSTIVHPQRGINNLKEAAREKREATARERQVSEPEGLPELAPNPLYNSVKQQRLKHDLHEKPQLPPAKEFLHQPYAAIQSTVQDHRGHELAENMFKSEIPHGASVQLIHQSHKIRDARDDGEQEAERKAFVQMKQLRQDAYVRWTMDRHVKRVGRMSPASERPRPPPLLRKPDATKPPLSWTAYAIEVGRYLAIVIRD